MIEVAPLNDAKPYLDHMRGNLLLNLPEVKKCNAHSHVMSIAGGGPSLKTTKDELKGYICAVNGSLKYLLDNNVHVDACGGVDPKPILTDIIVNNKDIHYYLASCVHPSLFEKMKDCHVIRWHASGVPGAEELLKKSKPDDWFMIGGGTTMALRWINIGYVCGFREFHIHGLDSSWEGEDRHAYSDNVKKNAGLMIRGRKTVAGLCQQINDFFSLLDRYSQDDVDDIKIYVYGEGLLQDCYTDYLNDIKHNDNLFTVGER